MDIAEYWDCNLGDKGTGHGLRQRTQRSYHDFPMDSLCGQQCARIVDQTYLLLAICDEAAAEPILEGAATAIGIICFG